MASQPVDDHTHAAARALQACLEGAAETFRRAHKSVWPQDVPIEYEVHQDEKGHVSVKLQGRVSHDPAREKERRRG